MKYAMKECAITGMSLGTHGSSVSLIDTDRASAGSKQQHLSPEICASFVNVLGEANIPPAELYDPRHQTFDIGGLKRLVKKSKEGDTVLQTIFAKFHTHPRAQRFLMQNFGVSSEDLHRWGQELSPRHKSASTEKRDSAHLH